MAEDIGLEPEFDMEPEPVEKKKKTKKAKEAVETFVKTESDEIKNAEVKNTEINLPPATSVDPSTMSITAKRKLKRKLAIERKKEEEQNPELAEQRKRQKLEEEEKQKNAKKAKYQGENKKLSFEAIETKFQVLLGKLSETTNRFKEGEAVIKKQVEEGKITINEANSLYRVYNRNLRIKKLREKLINKIGDQADLDLVKQIVGIWVRTNKVTKADAGVLIRRYKTRESRRMDRITEKIKTSSCFHCREPGHILANCPNKDGSQSEGICFKCGSTEHSSQTCKKKNIRGYPFATCFVCKQTGHISRDCHQNQNGVFPDGGGCNVCGATSHMKRDCPQMALEKAGANNNVKKEFTARSSIGIKIESADADYDPTEKKIDEAERKVVKKQAKHVKF